MMESLKLWKEVRLLEEIIDAIVRGELEVKQGWRSQRLQVSGCMENILADEQRPGFGTFQSITLSGTVRAT